MYFFTSNFFIRYLVKYRVLAVTILFSFYTLSLNAQNTDTLKIKKHSPTKATLMSACLPGLGQFYNKKYWKIPIIYAGAGLIAYFAKSNSDSMKVYKNAYKQRVDNIALDSFHNKYTTDDLLQLKNYYRRNLELTVIVAAGIYALNILDATVDAHLFYFNLSDDLTMKVTPVFIPFARYSMTGLSLTFKFNNYRKKQLLSLQ